MCSIELPTVQEIREMSPADVEALVLGLDVQRRRVEAAIATLTSRVGQTVAFVADGHRSVRTWGKAACNWSGAEAARFSKLGRAFELMPCFAEAADAGAIGVAQMHAIASVASNQRVRAHLAGSEALLVRTARGLDHDDFITLLHRWEQLADADGAEKAHERAHRDRRACLSVLGERMYLDAVGGVAHGVQLQEILDRFVQLEWQQEWDDGVARHGQAMNPSLMQRTPSQRRFDALVRALRAGAGSGEAGGDVTVNVLVDQATLEHHLALAAGSNPEPLDPSTVEHRRCESHRGVVLHPNDVLAAAIVGHVRRVVLDSHGVVLDFGRRKRLFTGSLREAVLLSERECIWPGCERPASQCQADHTAPHSGDGPTASRNGAPLCGHHNRWKTRGFVTIRGPAHQWNTLRVDGTTIGWRATLHALLLAA